MAQLLSIIALILLPELGSFEPRTLWRSRGAAATTPFDLNSVASILTALARQGDKNSFDLVLCLPQVWVTGGLEDAIIRNVLEYRAVISTCSDTQPPSFSDHHQLLYVILPQNKTGLEAALNQISKVYQIVKRRFRSTRMAKLLWLPMFLVIWPGFEDHCQGELPSTSQRLIEAVVTKSGSGGASRLVLNSDVYIHLGKECASAGDPAAGGDNLWEVYSPKEGSLQVQKLLPDTTPQLIVPIFERLLGKVRRRLDLHGASITAINSRDPSSYLEAPPPEILNPLQIVDGTPRVVFYELLHTLNFTENIVKGDWLSRYPNGSLKGSTANLFRKGMADITISVSSLLPYRKTELSYLQPTYSNSINGFFVQPNASSVRDIVVAPFSFWVWVALFATYVSLIMAILLFGRKYEKIATAAWGQDEHDGVLRNELALWAIGALAQQGWHTFPKCNSSRIAFTLGYLLSLICYAAFSGAVVSILAVELLPIQTRVGLLSSSLTFYADNASSTMAYIVDYLQQHTKINFGSKVNIMEGVARLKGNEPSCYIAFPHYFYLSAERIDISKEWMCAHLSILPVTTTATPSSMVIPRNSEFAEIFNLIILRMLSRGLNSRFAKLYNEATTWKCLEKSGKVFSPLGIKDVFTACWILFWGAVLSLTLLSLEKLSRLSILRAWEQEQHQPQLTSPRNDPDTAFPVSRKLLPL